MTAAKPVQWTLVQHSGAGYAGKPGFKRAVEPRSLSAAEARSVAKAGGMLFNSGGDVYAAEELVNFPPGTTGLYPQARGAFASALVDGLRIYIPGEGEAEDLGLRVAP